VTESLRLIVQTPAETLLDVDGVTWMHVELVQNRGVTIWPGHAPLLAEIAPQALRYADSGGTHTFELPAGILRFWEGQASVFLAGKIGEQAWPEEEEATVRFERLARAVGRSPSARDALEHP